MKIHTEGSHNLVPPEEQFGNVNKLLTGIQRVGSKLASNHEQLSYPTTLRNQNLRDREITCDNINTGYLVQHLL